MKRLFIALTLLAVSFQMSALAQDRAVQPEPTKIVEHGSACLSVRVGGQMGQTLHIQSLVRSHMGKFVDVVPTPLGLQVNCSLSADTHWAFQVTVDILTTFAGPKGSAATFKIMSVEIRDRQDNVRIGRPDNDAYDTDMYDHMTQAFIRALQAEPVHRPR